MICECAEDKRVLTLQEDTDRKQLVSVDGDCEVRVRHIHVPVIINIFS